MLRVMRSGSLGARRLAVATDWPAGTVPAHAVDPGTTVHRFTGLAAEHGRRVARLIPARPALAAAVFGRPLPARRGECDDPHEANSDQLRPAGGAGRDRRGRKAL